MEANFGTERRSIGGPILLSVAGDSLPTEFRIFAAGTNESSNGPALFDEAAAAAVMADYRQHGVDLMIDLEHLSVAAKKVSGDARNFDPDARGWFGLEVRNGELWAVNVTWTPEGAQRLRERKQRYVSPAFTVDSEGRVTSILNAAITAIPATHGAQALVASAHTDQGQNMDFKLLATGIKLTVLAREGVGPEEALRLLTIDTKTLQNVVKAMGGDPSADLATMMGTVAAFCEELVQAAQGKKAEKPSDKPAEAAPAESAPDAAMAARAATGEAALALSSAASDIEKLRAETERLTKQVALLRAESAMREASERHELVATLVKLGRETPATAWSDDSAKTPSEELQAIPLERLRARVKAFQASPLPKAPELRAASAVELTEDELRICAETKCDPKDFAAIKARREAARAGR